MITTVCCGKNPFLDDEAAAVSKTQTSSVSTSQVVPAWPAHTATKPPPPTARPICPCTTPGGPSTAKQPCVLNRPILSTYLSRCLRCSGTATPPHRHTPEPACVFSIHLIMERVQLASRSLTRHHWGGGGGAVSAWKSNWTHSKLNTAAPPLPPLVKDTLLKKIYCKWIHNAWFNHFSLELQL